MARKAKEEAVQAALQGARPPGKLQELVQQCFNLKSESDAARGELGSLMKNAEESHNIHRKAFKLSMQLNFMPEEKRADFLKAFDEYREELKLDEKRQGSIAFEEDQARTRVN